jgi:predicted kinase
MNRSLSAIHPGWCFNNPMIVLMAGLPGTGKTTLAGALAARISGRVISKDEVRHALFTRDEIDYSSRQDDFCLQIMLQTAAQLLERNPARVIFLDGRPFSRRYQIENAMNVAAVLDQSGLILECVCPEEVSRHRLEDQSGLGTHPAENRNFQLYLEVKSRFEAITLPKTVIDTSQPLETCVERALTVLR